MNFSTWYDWFGKVLRSRKNTLVARGRNHIQAPNRCQNAGCFGKGLLSVKLIQILLFQSSNPAVQTALLFFTGRLWKSQIKEKLRRPTIIDRKKRMAGLHKRNSVRREGEVLGASPLITVKTNMIIKHIGVMELLTFTPSSCTVQPYPPPPLRLKSVIFSFVLNIILSLNLVSWENLPPASISVE